MRFDPQSNFVPADNQPAANGSGPGLMKTLVLSVAVLLLVAGLGAGWMWIATGSDWIDPIVSKVIGDRPAEPNTSPVFVTSDFIAPIKSPVAVSEPVHQTTPVPVPDGNARAAFEAGRVQLARGNHVAAVPHFEEAIRIDPEFADAHYKLGLAHVRGRDLTAARAEQDALEQLNPNLANLLGNLIR